MADSVSGFRVIQEIGHQLLDLIVVMGERDPVARESSMQLAIRGVSETVAPVRGDSSDDVAYAMVAPVAIASTTLLDGLTELLARRFEMERIDLIPMLREYLDERIAIMSDDNDEE